MKVNVTKVNIAVWLVFQPAAKPVKPAPSPPKPSSSPSLSESSKTTATSSASSKELAAKPIGLAPPELRINDTNNSLAAVRVGQVMNLSVNENAAPKESKEVGNNRLLTKPSSSSSSPAAAMIIDSNVEVEETLSCKFCKFSCTDFTRIVDHIDKVHRMEYWYSCPYCTFGCSSGESSIIRHMKRSHSDQPSNVSINLIEEEKYFTRTNRPKHKNKNKQTKPSTATVLEIENEDEDCVYTLKSGKKAVGNQPGVSKASDVSDKASVISEEGSVIVQKTVPTVITVGPNSAADDMPLDMSVSSKSASATVVSSDNDPDVTILTQPPQMPPKLTTISPVFGMPPSAHRPNPPPLIPLGTVDKANAANRKRLETPPLLNRGLPSQPSPITIEPPPAHVHPPSKPSPNTPSSSHPPHPKHSSTPLSMPPKAQQVPQTQGSSSSAQLSSSQQQPPRSRGTGPSLGGGRWARGSNRSLSQA